MALHTLGGEKLPNVVVNDISTSGISVFVSLEAESQLASLWEFKLSLQLPQERESIDFVATVRQRRLSGSAIACGIEFDVDATESFDSKEERIQAYVMQRQREILQAKRGTGEG